MTTVEAFISEMKEVAEKSGFKILKGIEKQLFQYEPEKHIEELKHKMFYEGLTLEEAIQDSKLVLLEKAIGHSEQYLFYRELAFGIAIRKIKDETPLELIKLAAEKHIEELKHKMFYEGLTLEEAIQDSTLVLLEDALGHSERYLFYRELAFGIAIRKIKDETPLELIKLATDDEDDEITPPENYYSKLLDDIFNLIAYKGLSEKKAVKKIKRMVREKEKKWSVLSGKCTFYASDTFNKVLETINNTDSEQYWNFYKEEIPSTLISFVLENDLLKKTELESLILKNENNRDFLIGEIIGKSEQFDRTNKTILTGMTFGQKLRNREDYKIRKLYKNRHRKLCSIAMNFYSEESKKFEAWCDEKFGNDYSVRTYFGYPYYGMINKIERSCYSYDDPSIYRPLEPPEGLNIYKISSIDERRANWNAPWDDAEWKRYVETNKREHMITGWARRRRDALKLRSNLFRK